MNTRHNQAPFSLIVNPTLSWPKKSWLLSPSLAEEKLIVLLRKWLVYHWIQLPCLFNLYVEHIMRNAGLDELQAGIKIGRRNFNNLSYADDTTLLAESKEELKGPLMRMKKESGWASLNLHIKKTKVMASAPIPSRQTTGEKVKTVTEFLFLGSKITADGDCSHEIGGQLLLGRKSMTNLVCWKAETLLCWQRSG